MNNIANIKKFYPYSMIPKFSTQHTYQSQRGKTNLISPESSVSVRAHKCLLTAANSSTATSE